MDSNFTYRFSKKQKLEIARNLIEILDKDSAITDLTRTFVGNWILSTAEEKNKSYYDVWEIVLKNYLPKSRPVLYRACKNVSKIEKIVSFTGRLECAKRFCEAKNTLLICDTKETLQFEDIFNIGEYKHTFYPLVDVLKKAKESDGWGFSERLLETYIGEDEYILKICKEDISSFSKLNIGFIL